MAELVVNAKIFWVGIGYQRGVSSQFLAKAIHQVWVAYGLDWDAIAGLATLDRKADDPDLRQLCQAHNWSLCLFSAEELQVVEGATPSAEVNVQVGTPSVAEAAALKAAQTSGSAQANLVITKQIVRDCGQPGAITVAVAQP